MLGISVFRKEDTKIGNNNGSTSEETDGRNEQKREKKFCSDEIRDG